MKTYQIKVLSLPTKRGNTTELLDFVVSSESSLKGVYDHYEEKFKPLGVLVKEVPILVLNIVQENKEEIQNPSKTKVFKNKITCDVGKALSEEYSAAYRELELSTSRFNTQHQNIQKAIKNKYPGIISVNNINCYYGKFEAEVIYKPEEILTLEEIK